jgi:hypothetical protein
VAESGDDIGEGVVVGAFDNFFSSFCVYVLPATFDRLIDACVVMTS